MYLLGFYSVGVRSKLVGTERSSMFCEHRGAFKKSDGKD